MPRHSVKGHGFQKVPQASSPYQEEKIFLSITVLFGLDKNYRIRIFDFFLMSWVERRRRLPQKGYRYSSVANPGCLSRIRIRIRLKKCKFFNPKKFFYALENMIRDVHPGSGSPFRILIFYPSRAQIQGSIFLSGGQHVDSCRPLLVWSLVIKQATEPLNRGQILSP